MSLTDRDPEKIRAWRERGARRYAEKRRANPGKGLAPVGRKAKREQPAVAAFRRALKIRSSGFCEASTPACLPYRHEGHHAHHCCPADRDRGVHDPERGLWLCAPGHEWAHRHPAESYKLGLLIRDGVA